MKFFNRRLVVSLALVLLCALMLPYLASCEDKDVATTTGEEVITKEEKPGDYIPMVGGSGESTGDSMASTPNKGGSSMVVSGGASVKSAYSQAMEELTAALENSHSIQAQTIANKRDLAEKYMRTMLTIRWTPESDVRYGLSSTTGTDLVFYAGRTYSGIPYTNGSSGLEAFNLYVKEGSTDVAKTTFGQKQLAGANTAATVGTDEVDALLYTWNTVSDTIFAHSQADMIPVNGFIFLGDYQIPQMENYNTNNPVYDRNPFEGFGEPSSRTLTYDGTLAKDTDDICKYNKEQKMYAAYAKLLKADGLIRYDDTATGAYMAVSVDVKTLANGTIDGENSTVTVLHQTNDLFKAGTQKDGVYLIGEVDKKVTFKELFDNNFIPVTITDFQDGTTQSLTFVRDSLNAAKDYTAANLYKGFITTSQRVVSATMKLTDDKGEKVFEFTTLSFQGDVKVATENRYGFDVTKISAAYAAGRGVGDQPLTTSQLQKGKKYTCVLTVNMVGGKSEVAREFTFTA